MAHMNPIEVQSHLGGADYPATKEALIECAKENEAPEEVMETLEALPDEEYISPAHVTKAISEVAE